MCENYIIITLAALTGTTAWCADQLAYLPPEIIGYIATFVDQRTLQRLAPAGAGRAGAARGFSEIARRENAGRAARFLQQHNGNAQVAFRDAIENNYPWVIGYLKQQGADVNAAIDQYGKTPLIEAAQNGREALVVQLIAARANVNTKCNSGNTALLSAIQYNHDNHEAIVARLIAANTNVNAANTNGNTPLMYAASQGQNNVVAQLIAAGADVDSKDKYGNTSLILAIEKCHEVVVAQLITARARVNARNGTGLTALMLATEYNHEAIVAQLIAAGANVNLKSDNAGDTALMMAAYHGHEAIIAQLIAARAEVNVKNKIGDTALICAIQSGHEAIAKLLIRADADISILDNDQKRQLEEWIGG